LTIRIKIAAAVYWRKRDTISIGGQPRSPHFPGACRNNSKQDRITRRSITWFGLHADLGGQIEKNREEARRLTEDMKHVEAVIKLFDPAYSVQAIAARRRQNFNKWFERGTMFRAAVDVLKASPLPMTLREIVRSVLARQGVTAPDPKDMRMMENGIRACLRSPLKRTRPETDSIR
jgi:hypothetical protein